MDVINKSERILLVDKIEKLYNARYVGYYDLPGRSREFGAFYVFWQDEVPEKFKGDDRYDNYFAIMLHYAMDGLYPSQIGSPTVYITGAKAIREAKFNALEVEPGKFIVSRYRHDYVSYKGDMLDGGLAYCRHGARPPSHYMVLEDGKEVYYAIADFEAGRRDHGLVQEQAEQTDAGAAVPASDQVG